MAKAPDYNFRREAAIAINSDQSKSLILHGNTRDLFFHDTQPAGQYIPLVDFLSARWNIPGQIIIVYEASGKIRIQEPVQPGEKSNREKLKDAWLQWKTGASATDLQILEMLSVSKLRSRAQTMTNSFDTIYSQAEKDPLVAIELLRQLCACSRTFIQGKPLLVENLIIIFAEADIFLPEGDASRMSIVDRRTVGMCAEWFSDPLFTNGRDSVVLIAETTMSINQRVSKLPHVLSIEISFPDEEAREHFIRWFDQCQPDDAKLDMWDTPRELAVITGGLSIHALMQLLRLCVHKNKRIEPDDVVRKIEEFIRSQLGEEVVEFHRPTHRLKDVVGNRSLKKFLNEKFLPRIRLTSKGAISGAAVAGPIGSGKTFIFEALAAELGIVVLTLKNIRSMWYGQTDVVLERLKRILSALSKVMVIVDEADTQFGGVGSGTHETERRLTGKIHAMMSDGALKGKVIWLLMTARINQLSPDLRRPGRAGDLIMPVFDPEDEDLEDFIAWALKPACTSPGEQLVQEIKRHTQGYSAAAFASLRGELIAEASGEKLTDEQILAIVQDLIPADIGKEREIQKLQALLNVTRVSLIPASQLGNNSLQEAREQWRWALKRLEAQTTE